MFPEDGPERRVLTVRQLNEEISAAVDRAFPGTIWVRGEVQRLPVDAARRTHVYFELHEAGRSGAAEYQIPVSLMGWDRQRYGLGSFLDGSDPDFQLANKMEVCLECQVDFYAKFGKMSLKIVGVDKSFALGKLEALRRETLAFLQAQELLERNASIPLPDLPLRIGLITSPGSAAEQDFMTGIERSPWAFRVSLRGAKMQGDQLEAEVIRALQAHVAAGVDVVVITRGGGSRADLSWFDQRELAVAIAEAPVPVITAIGHEIDRSIADLVAHHSCKTPTAGAEYLVDRVGQASRQLDKAAERLKVTLTGLLDTARDRVEVGDRMGMAIRGVLLRSRIRLQHMAGRFQDLVSVQLNIRERRLSGLETGLVSRTIAVVGRSTSRLDRLHLQVVTSANGRLSSAVDRYRGATRRLGREALRPLVAGQTRVEGLATQARLLDPERLLARGYTLTLGPLGTALTSADSVVAGDCIRTRFSDGEVTSIVQPAGKFPGSSSSSNRKGKQSGGKGKKTDPGQKTLFR
ncbi:MAG: exodeoxyribonuclease VII large subunit [Gemmatimonadales bacterium]|nr:exodeoxyribonuclease VII large subunit [Gemmatimonadales bacterium]